MNSISFELRGEKLELLPERAILWKSKGILVVSDLHLGKAGHFRKHGIPISRNVHLKDLQILEHLIKIHEPQKVILLGDLFHSYENKEWNDFIRFIQVYDVVEFVLVRGNHDILDEYPIELTVIESLDIIPFNFTHEREESSLYNLSGHIHPGYRVVGLAREGLTVPCFYFSQESGVLPAFGQFTGVKRIKTITGDRIFGIAEDNVIELI